MLLPSRRVVVVEHHGVDAEQGPLASPGKKEETENPETIRKRMHSEATSADLRGGEYISKVCILIHTLLTGANARGNVSQL